MECLCLSGAFRRRGGAAALLALALLGGACDNVDFTVYVRVSLGADPDLAATGVTILITITNEEGADVGPYGDAFEVVITDPGGREVRRLPDTTGAGLLRAGQSLTVEWNQEDHAGLQVAPGTYTASARYLVAGRSGTVRDVITIY